MKKVIFKTFISLLVITTTSTDVFASKRNRTDLEDTGKSNATLERFSSPHESPLKKLCPEQERILQAIADLPIAPGFEGNFAFSKAQSSQTSEANDLKRDRNDDRNDLARRDLEEESELKKAAPDSENSLSIGNFSYLPKDVTKLILWMTDPSSFSRMAQTCKEFKNLTDGIRAFEFTPEELENMLRGGVTEDLLFRVVKPIMGMNQLRDFFLSYFDRPKSERVMGKGEREFFSLFPERTSDHTKMTVFRRHAPIWQPYATAYAICEHFKRMAYKRTEMLPFHADTVLYPFYTTINRVSGWDSQLEKRQKALLDDRFFSLASHLFVNARNSHDIDFAHSLRQGMIEKTHALASSAAQAAQNAETSSEKYVFYKKAAQHFSAKLLLLDDKATARDYNGAAHMNRLVAENSETSVEKYEHYKKVAQHINAKLLLLGDRARALDYSNVAYANCAACAAGQNAVTSAEKYALYKKAATHFEKVLVLLGERATATDYKKAGSANFAAGQNAETSAEKYALYKKAVQHLNENILILGEMATATDYIKAGSANFAAGQNAETSAEKYALYKKAVQHLNENILLLGERATATDYKIAAMANFAAGQNAETSAEKYALYKQEGELFEKGLESNGDKESPNTYKIIVDILSASSP